MVERAIQTDAASVAPTKKGMRQAQLLSSASLEELTTAAETPTASSAPTSLAADAQEVMRPRRAGLAPSSK
jgi:hypothetical protein